MDRSLKLSATIARWLFILCLPVLLATASVAWAVNSFWLYRSGMDMNNVGQTTGLSSPELDKAVSGLIRYWNSGEDLINVTVMKDGKPFQLFNERETVHLRDVKTLIRRDYGLLAAALIYVIGYKGASLFLKRKRSIAREVFLGSGLTLLLMLALGAGIATDFSQLFWQFHLLSFSNEFWLLDPSRDYLIMMFPEPFWNRAAGYIALATAAGAVVSGGASAIYMKMTREQKA